MKIIGTCVDGPLKGLRVEFQSKPKLFDLVEIGEPALSGSGLRLLSNRTAPFVWVQRPNRQHDYNVLSIKDGANPIDVELKFFRTLG